jgi:hypothetical protein
MEEWLRLFGHKPPFGAFVWGGVGVGKTTMVEQAIRATGAVAVNVSMSDLKTRQQVEKLVLHPLSCLDVTGKGKVVVVDDYHDSGDCGGVQELCRISSPSRAERTNKGKAAALQKFRGINPLIVVSRTAPAPPCTDCFHVIHVTSGSAGDRRARRMAREFGPAASLPDQKRPHETIVRAAFRGEGVYDATRYDALVFFENYMCRLAPDSIDDVADASSFFSDWEVQQGGWSAELLRGISFILSHLWVPKTREPLKPAPVGQGGRHKPWGGLVVAYLGMDPSRSAHRECLLAAGDRIVSEPSLAPLLIPETHWEALLRARPKRVVSSNLRREIKQAYRKHAAAGGGDEAV